MLSEACDTGMCACLLLSKQCDRPVCLDGDVLVYEKFNFPLCPPGPVNSACWIRHVDFAIVTMAPRCTTPPVFLSIRSPQITPPGEG